MSNGSNYTDADVQAARQALIEASVSHYDPDQQPHIRKFAESMFGPSDPSVTTVLDAVAPAITARAKAEALREAVRDIFGSHVLCAPCADHLDRRADEIEAGR